MATKPIESTIVSSSNNQTQMCPRYEHAIQILGKRWTGLLLDALMSGPRRFCEMTTLVEGLSDRVLSDRLRELELEGVVQRVVYPQIPVRVEYQLTEKGYALKPVIDAIHAWAQQWVPAPTSAQDAHIDLMAGDDDCYHALVSRCSQETAQQELQ